jgi:pimeloyl-ACP methyl ester carboxylesterase
MVSRPIRFLAPVREVVRVHLEQKRLDQPRRTEGGRRADGQPDSEAAWMERRVSGARVVRLPNAHHYLFITHAPAVQREIAAFVKGLSLP